MVMDNQLNSETARASSVRNQQRLPGPGWARLKKQVQQRRVKEWRVGSMNIGTLNRKGQEIADLVDRRKVDILCLQETRWKGKKSKDLAGGHKLIYNGEAGRNSVAIALSAKTRESLVQVNRSSKRVIRVQLREGKTNMSIISAYVLQLWCEEDEKVRLWKDPDDETAAVPEDEKVIIRGDLNGHVGRNRHGIKKWHGGWSVGEQDPGRGEDTGLCNRARHGTAKHLLQKRREPTDNI